MLFHFYHLHIFLMKNSRRASWNESVRTSMRDSTQTCPEALTTTNTVMQTKTSECMHYAVVYVPRYAVYIWKKSCSFGLYFWRVRNCPAVSLNKDDHHIPVSHGAVLWYKAFCKSLPSITTYMFGWKQFWENKLCHIETYSSWQPSRFVVRSMRIQKGRK